MHGMALNEGTRNVVATTGYLEVTKVDTKEEDEDRYQDRYESHHREEGAMGTGHYDRLESHNDGSSGYHHDGTMGSAHHDDELDDLST